jgi:hypothetical protein
MELNTDNDDRKKHPHIEWVFLVFGSGSILFAIVYWILRASSYDYTDVIYLTADYEYGKYFGAAFDTVCGILPAILVGIPLLVRGFLFPARRKQQLAAPPAEEAHPNELDAESGQ